MTGDDRVPIRFAKNRDLKAIVENWETFMDCHRDYDRWFHLSSSARERFRDYMASEINRDESIVLVAEGDEGIVGYLAGRENYQPLVFQNPRHCMITDLFVCESHRHRGIARELIEKVIGWCRDKEIGRLELAVAPGNVGARAVYEKLDFQTVLHHLYLEI